MPRAFAPDVVVVDVGPNLGAINRSALIGTDYVVIPLAPDLYSLQGLRNLGPTLRRRRQDYAGLARKILAAIGLSTPASAPTA